MAENTKRNSDNVEVKIGTCSDMYYLRHEDLNAVTPAASQPGLRFRLPFPDEDEVRIGEYAEFNRGTRLWDDSSRADYVPAWLSEAAPGRLQMHHSQSGLLLSVPCHHGTRLPDLGPNATVHWNGKGHSIELSSVKTTDNGVVPVVRCRHCDSAWSTSWDDVLPFVFDDALKARLATHVIIESYLPTTSDTGF